MREISKKEVKELMEKYKSKMATQFNIPVDTKPKVIQSREYTQFKKENLPTHLSYYEKACNISEKLLKIHPDEKTKNKINEAINVCHLNITPSGAVSFAILAPLLLAFFGGLLSFIIFNSLFFAAFFVVIAAILYTPFNRIPEFLANNWRLKGSNQMVLCIFYIVTYMRHTPNLELAIEFASDHLSPPLSLDLKKVLWDVETEKYESIKESLDMYLETWRKYNMEFIEATHLIESSLYETSDQRRLSLLDKSLDVILNETYEKMLHYAHNLKSPITMLHMLGIILPILGLVILPMVVSFMGSVRWYHLFALYNVLLPIAVYYLGKIILSKRPTGYGDTDIAEINPELRKHRNIIFKLGPKEIKIHPIFIALFVFIVLFGIGTSPIWIHSLDCNSDYIIDERSDFIKICSLTDTCDDGVFVQDESTINCVTGEQTRRAAKFYFLEYKVSSAEEGPDVGKVIGPFGLGAALLSVFIPLSFGLALGLYFRLRTRNVMGIRNKTKALEKEFANGIFQLGNRLGDGLPAELSFEKVADVMEGTLSGNFFGMVAVNIRKMGMSVKQAIFNRNTGALLDFPSNVIESSMKVLIQSIKKGPKVAAQSLINISRYIKEIHKVDERLKDLLADIISSMKSQIKFLTPIIAGIVIGITSMITTILSKLSVALAKAKTESAGEVASVPALFGDGIPTIYFQVVVGIYVIQIIYILTVLANGIENGTDKLNERHELGKNLIRSSLLFCITSLVVMLLFNIIASNIIMQTI